MVRVGITGHINLTTSSVTPIYEALVVRLRLFPAVRGITCLAAGADQLFARAVRDIHGTYEVILPAPDYRHHQTARGNGRLFDELLSQASAVSCVPCERSDDAAYAAASGELLRRCDHLLAVWDRAPDGRVGSTAHTVAQARAMGVPVTVIWPSGAARRLPAVGPRALPAPVVKI